MLILEGEILQNSGSDFNSVQPIKFKVRSKQFSTRNDVNFVQPISLKLKSNQFRIRNDLNFVQPISFKVRSTNSGQEMN